MCCGISAHQPGMEAQTSARLKTDSSAATLGRLRLRAAVRSTTFTNQRCESLRSLSSPERWARRRQVVVLIGRLQMMPGATPLGDRPITGRESRQAAEAPPFVVLTQSSSRSLTDRVVIELRHLPRASADTLWLAAPNSARSQ